MRFEVGEMCSINHNGVDDTVKIISRACSLGGYSEVVTLSRVHGMRMVKESVLTDEVVQRKAKWVSKQEDCRRLDLV